MLSLDKELVKGKRGRKSKKELMASLGLEEIATTATAVTSVTVIALEEHISLSVVEINEPSSEFIDALEVETELKAEVESEVEAEVTPVTKLALKKRGRKPKGGKIIQQSQLLETQKNDKPNVILHLKCSMKDLQNLTHDVIESYAFNKANNLCYDVIGSENINSSNSSNNNNSLNSNKIDDNEYDYNYNDEDINANSNANANTNANDANDIKESTAKELWKKLKQLEHNLHINNVNNKKSACFWDTCDFDNPPVYIPKHFINGTYHVYGCFCSPECGVAYLMNENIDSSTKFERYHLFNHIYSKMYDYKRCD